MPSHLYLKCSQAESNRYLQLRRLSCYPLHHENQAGHCTDKNAFIFLLPVPHDFSTHRKLLQIRFYKTVVLTMSANSAFKDAPPTSPPSMFGILKSSWAFLALTEPP